jgi:hypothetical protein
MHPHTIYPLLFIAVAWVVFFLIGDYAERRFDSERSRSRFPERSPYEWTEDGRYRLDGRADHRRVSGLHRAA